MPAAVELLTFEEFEKLPEEPGKTELLDGEVIQMPPAKKKHNQGAENLYDRLKPMTKRPEFRAANPAVGEVHLGMGYQIGHDPDSWLAPDVSVTYPDQPGEDYYEGAPLIAIEVISESNTAAKVYRKIQKYFTGGGREVWILYPEARHVLTHYSDRDEVEIGREYIRSRLLPEVKEILLSEIW